MKKYFQSMPNKRVAYFFLFVIMIFFIGGIFLLFVSSNVKELTIGRVDLLGLLFGIISLIFSILMTIKIQDNADKLSGEIANEHQKDNDYIIKITESIKGEVGTLLNQYRNVEVLSKFTIIIQELDKLYSTVIDASDGKIEINSKFSSVKMQLKIMNYSASFGKLLCNNLDTLIEFKPDIFSNGEIDTKLKNSIKDTVIELAAIQRSTYRKMLDAFAKADADIMSDNAYKNKYYITLSADKDISGNKTSVKEETAYYHKYLCKISLNDNTAYIENFNKDKKYVMTRNENFEHYFIAKQFSHMQQLSTHCTIYDIHSSTIPFQVFVTMPVDESITDERFYKCILFFINENTMGKALPLNAISTSNREFVKTIIKVLDAEKESLTAYNFLTDN